MSKCLQGKSSGRKKCGRKCVATKWDNRKLAKTGVPVSRSTTYLRIKEMGYDNHIPRVKPLLNFKQCKKRLTWATGEGSTGQLDSGLELSSLMSRSCAFRSETEDHEFGGSLTKLTSLAARNPALNFHTKHHGLGRNVSRWSWTSVFSANMRESRRRRWLLVDQLLWSS